MNGSPWASYRAAAPPECFGEPDNDESRPCPPQCAGCGRFVPKGTPEQWEPASHAGKARVWWICPACEGKVPTARTPEQCRADDEADRAAYDVAMKEMWEQESREVAARGDAEAAGFRAWESAMANEPIAGPPNDDEDIPW